MEFSEYYVAYFDVLGYKEAFKKSKDFSAKLIDAIEFSIKIMKKIVSIHNTTILGESTEKIPEIEYKVFSDNVLICYKETKDDLSALSLVSFLRLVATIQRVFFERPHLIVRGGITKGPLYLTKDFVGGKALIEAVELENNAVYPRIVVDDCILNELNLFKMKDELSKSVMEASCLDLLVKDTDGKYFLNYIMSYDAWIIFPKNSSQLEPVGSFEELEQNVREGCQLKPIYNPECLREVFVILKKHKDFVEEKVIEFSQSSNDGTEEAKRLKILKKYLWLVSFHNKICDHVLYKMPELKINLKSEFNEQTLAFDVSVD
ncbi:MULTISPECIES: hypothetical protein [Fibrobacter]|uniref:hypothetical protein n=1 Tax=Fibrobacter TaxID=832 RepID=UPI000B523CAA|nr:MULTISPECIES: hypothetical protein [Fibrobacter]OWV17666.1 hypothetical protein B7990_09235 [Fibrobacter sp. UWB4]